MTRIISITGNSGSGKTSIALNLGIALSQKGKDVLLMDGNIYSGDLQHYLDITPGFFLNEFLDGKRNIDEIITNHPTGMKVISSIAEEEHDEAKNSKIDDALLQLLGKAELILVDSFSHSPALHSTLSNTDETIFVTNDDYPSIIKSKEFISSLEKKGITVLGLIINKKRKESSKEHIEAIIGKKILAELPHDKKMIDSVNIRQPVYLLHPKSDISKQIDSLAELLK